MSTNKKINLNNTFLFVCDAMQNHDALSKKDFGSLKDVEIITNTAVLAMGKNIKNAPKDIVVWKTDENGVLRNIDSSFKHSSPVYLGPNQDEGIKFFLPSSESLQIAWAAKKTDWRKEIAEHFSKHAQHAQSLEKIEITPSQLKKPGDDADDEIKRILHTEIDEEIKKQSKLSKNKKLHGFLLTKVKGICVVFSDPIFNGAIVTTSRKDKASSKKIPVEKNDKGLPVSSQFIVEEFPANDKGQNLYATLVYAKPGTDLPGNEMYTFTVTSTEKVKPNERSNWNENLLDSKGIISYKFQAKIVFPMRSYAGSFDMIVGDPVSIEEALITQYPDKYSHLVEMAKGKADWDPDFKKVLLKDSETKETDSLDKIIGYLNLINEVTKFSKGIITRDTTSVAGNFKLSKLLASTALKGAEGLDENTKKSIGLFFNVTNTGIDLYKDYNLIYDVFKNASFKTPFFYYLTNPGFVNNKLAKITSVLETQYGIKQPSNFLPDFLSSKEAKEARKAHKIASDKIKELAKKELFEDASKIDRVVMNNLPQEADFLSKVDKTIAYLDLILSGYEFYKSSKELYGDWNNKKDIDTLFKKYLEILNDEVLLLDKEHGYKGAPCREAFLKLETQRQSQTLAGIKLTKAQIEEVKKGVLLALAAMTAFGGPVTAAIAGFITLVWGIVELCFTASELLSHYLYDGVPGFDPDIGKMFELNKSLEVENRSNFPKLTEKEEENGGIYNSELQLRIRAEALSGLYALINRAASRSGKVSEEDYDAVKKKFMDKIEAYNIEGYINEFILGDKWTTSLETSIPVTMDEIWLFSKGSKFAAEEAYSSGIMAVNNNEADADSKVLKVFENHIKKSIARKYDLSPFFHEEEIDDIYEETLDEAEKNDASWIFKESSEEAINIIEVAKKLDINPFFYAGQDIKVGDEKNANVARANFQEIFPIQKIIADKWEEMCYNMRAYFSEINKDTVAYTCLYYREAKKGQGPLDNWKPLSKKKEARNSIIDKINYYTSCQHSYSMEESAEIYQNLLINPFHEIRILVIFKADKDNEFKGINYPVKIGVNRYDGCDLNGPVYKTQTKTLVKADLLDNEEGYIGRVGCVFHPFYDLGTVKHGGIKPMHSKGVMERVKSFLCFFGDWKGYSYLDPDLKVENAANSGLFDIMEYGIKLTIGNNNEYNEEMTLSPAPEIGYHGTLDDETIKKSYVNGQHKYFYIGINPFETSHKLLLDWDFLGSRTTKMPALPLFDAGQYNLSFPMLRFGGGKLQNKTGYENDYIPFAIAYTDIFKNLQIPQKNLLSKNNNLFLQYNHGYSEADRKYFAPFIEDAMEKDEKSISIREFDWNTQLDLATITMCRGHIFEENIKNWEKYGLKWKNGIAIDNQMMRLDGNGIICSHDTGPKMRTKLHYLGKYDKEITNHLVNHCLRQEENDKMIDGLKKTKVEDIKNIMSQAKFIDDADLEKNLDLQKIQSMFTSNTSDEWLLTIFSYLLHHSMSTTSPKNEKYDIHIFVSINTPQYVPPNSTTGKLINCIRPFGDEIADISNWQLDNKSYQYFLSNYKTPKAEVGIDNEFIKGKFVFNFEPPKDIANKQGLSGLKNPLYPWNKEKILTDEELITWIEEESEMTAPPALLRKSKS